MSENINEYAFTQLACFADSVEYMLDEPIESTLPALALRNMMLFPCMLLSVTLTRESSQKLMKKAYKDGSKFAVFAQKQARVADPHAEDLYDEGVLAAVMNYMPRPEGHAIAVIQSFGPLRMLKLKRRNSNLRVDAESIEEEIPNDDDKEFEALVEACQESVSKCIKFLSGIHGEEMLFALRSISNPVLFINFACTYLPLQQEERYRLFRIHDVKQRAYSLLEVLNREIQYGEIKLRIQEQTREELDKQQKEYFLQQQIKNIQSELGEDQNPDVKSLEKKAAELLFPERVRTSFMRELEKLKRLNPQNPDYNVALNYLQTITEVPWGKYTADNLNVKNAERVLNRDHYGMERVKERILEYIATLQFRQDKKAPILCLYGPPGVGKTSLGRSIAEALGRKYVRVSLGGVHDEAEIRGHRRTYIGAMPGRIVKGLIKAESSNPLFVLDEIDKVSESNYNGDPHSALLEVLDPEQNSTFHDNFLDLDCDLSKVLFVATANSLQTIPRPLLDRMEIIEVEGYLAEEKREIARKHLVPKEQRMFNFGEGNQLKFSAAAIDEIIEHYTRESGVRQLEKQIEKVFRKVAYLTSTSSEGEMPYAGRSIKPADVESLLGKRIFTRDKYQGNRYAGVVTGLAWTAVGGEILFIETSLSRSKGPKLTLTGNLGDVMKESAVLALEYIKAHADKLGIDYSVFDSWSIHVHVPEGATPKDGPSAGITIATSLASALTQRRVRDHVAMTGEITLRGRVLPVGGIKEKILAAKRAGITDIVMSEENRRDIEEIKQSFIHGLTFHFVKEVKEVFDFALLDEKVDDALDLTASPETAQ